MNTKKIFAVSCCLMALGIVLGAFAAHGLKDKVSPYHIEVFQKGVFYHLVHALALLVLTLNVAHFNLKRLKLAMWLMVVGILFFSGSLYVLGGMALEKGDGLLKVVGPVTPIGGLCFIAGWLALIFAYNKPVNQ